jgi:Ice-binding-like/Bacterial Ig-like domain
MIRERIYERGVGLATLFLAAAIAGCGIGNTADTTKPTVSSTIPVAAATGVAMNGSLAVTFSKKIDPSTITGATFTLKLGTTPVPGTVSYTGVTATFSPTQALTASSSYTATITSAKDLAGNALASSYSWSFSTGGTADTTAPVASSTVPANGAVSVATNAALTATFSEAMDPATISTATFTATGPGAVAVAGTVTYVGQTATFHPTTVLATDTLFTATITTGAKDLAGNALAADSTWSFTTAAAPDTTPPTVASTIPTSGAVSVATNAALTATFSEAMDPATISTATFTVTGPSAAAVTGTVTYVGQTATFHPASVLAAGTLFSATITTGVTDLAGNALAASYTSSFTTGNTHVGLSPVLLGSAVNYVILAKTGISTVPDSVVTGDVALSPAAASFITGFSLTADPTNVFSTSPQVTGKIYAADYAVPTPSNLTTAVLDMQAAYTDAAGRPTPDFLELNTGAIGGLTLAPGLYKWAGTVTIPSDVTLTGSATDVWIFQIAGDLTMSSATNVFLSGGALAKNVFWQVAGAVDVGTTAHFEGIALSQTAMKLHTGASMNGRALAQSAVTLDQATVTQPAP